MCRSTRADRTAEECRSRQFGGDSFVGGCADRHSRLPRRFDPQHAQSAPGGRLPGGRCYGKSRKLLYDADFRKPTALVMGAEDTGISKEVLKLCDEQLAILMIGKIESLNVSAAAAVLLFEIVRQRIG